MSARMMWSATITYEDWLIGIFDEITIEARVCELQSKKNLATDSPKLQKFSCELRRRDLREHILALQRIDILRKEERLQNEISRIRSEIEQEKIEFQNTSISDEMWETIRRNSRNFENLFHGLRSPDLVQRARFQGMYDEQGLSAKSVPEAAALLAALERAKLPKGRHKLVPLWRDVVDHLDFMRELCGKGNSIPQAARAAARAEGKPSGQESRAKLFEKRYRQRAKLRELKP